MATLERSRRLIGGVWKYVSASENSGNGGSQPGAVRLLDLGTLDAATVAADGPQLLYTPDAGERVYGAQVTNVTLPDQDAGLFVGVLADLVTNFSAPETVALAFTHTDLVGSIYVNPDGEDTASLYGVGSATSGPAGVLADPVVAAWISGQGVVTAAAAAWQALHPYSLGDVVFGDTGYIEICTLAGTSGASEPTWPSDGSSGIPDGSVEWSEAPLPTVGGFDLAFHVSLPDTP
jgi:hypothetical protein